MREIRLFFAGFVFLAGCSSGNDAPPGTYKNDAFKFTLVPPPGWTILTPSTEAPDKIQEFLTKYGDRLLDTARQPLLQPVSGRNTLAALIVKTDSDEPLLPMIGVLHNSVGLPQVGEAEKEKSRAALKGRFRSSGDASEESAEVIDVDGLKAVRIGYRATLETSLQSNANSRQRFQVRYVDTMIASRQRTHFLSLTAEAAASDAHVATYNQVLASFRSFGER